ncbi:MAG TPA: TIGR03790 family protein [Vicinamibacterales bacterium]|nr:TIGR03790 family protein [Vicinamibacterales bacterium]
MTLRAAVLTAALASVPVSTVPAPSDNVLLVVNRRSQPSNQIADHYIQVRHLQERNVVRLETTEADSISRADFASTIEAPISRWIERQRLHDQILFIVVTKGVPLRVEGTSGQLGTEASVDSELTLLYRKMLGKPAPLAGRVDNPYFLGDKPITAAAHFTRQASDLYLVTRLDAFTVEDALKLIDRGAAPVNDGKIVLDQKATVMDRGGDAWLAAAAARLREMNQGSRIALETTTAVAGSTEPVLGYFSWGSNDPANQRRQMGLRFANGAIGGMFVSTDGRTFKEPPADWRPAVAGSSTGGQSLIGDLIREGITGVSGHVSEPFLDAIIRPQVLFPAYLSGFNLAESFYMAMPYLSWQDIVIGDPLCSVSAGAAAPPGASPDVDPETELPRIFAERQLALLTQSGLNVDALKLALKAGSFQAQERPVADIEALLVKATALEPRLVAAQLKLAQMAEAQNRFDDAIQRYRAVLATEPGNIAALNNLAYQLAERKDGAKEALPLAERAYALSGRAPVIADTLGWVHYQLGELPAALPLIEQAAKAEPSNLDILVHAAMVNAAMNNVPKARAFLDAALKVDPKVIDRADVKALAARIR